MLLLMKFQMIINHKLVVCGLFLVTIGMSGICCDRCSAETDMNEVSTSVVVTMMNSIRQSPMAYAEKIGYKEQPLTEILHRLDGFSQSNPVMLEGNPFLALKAAAGNSEDPLVIVPDIMPENDYVKTGEVGGVVSFYNFLDLNTALTVVVNNLFEKEMLSEFQGQRYILSSDYDQVGVAVRTGVVWGNTGRKNAYFITICFASSILKQQVQLLNLINQVRFQPSLINNYALFNLNAIIHDNFNAIEAFSYAYPPLFMDRALQALARMEMISLLDWEAEAHNQGGPAAVMERSGAVAVLFQADAPHSVLQGFSALMQGELARYPEKQAVFNGAFEDAGVAMQHVAGVAHNLVEISLVTAAPETAGHASLSGCLRIYGLIYRDMDGNGVYTPGEGVPAGRVVLKEILEGKTANFPVYSDNAGHFDAVVHAPGLYEVQWVGNDENAEKNVFVDGNTFVEIVVP